MPRLPTIRVIGSQDISTRPVSSAVAIALPFRWYLGTPGSPALLVAGQQLVALLAPLGLLVGGLGRKAAQRPDDRPVQGAGGRRHLRAGRLVHERHELVGEAGHRARDADAPDVRTAAHAAAPAALRHVAVDD